MAKKKCSLPVKDSIRILSIIHFTIYFDTKNVYLIRGDLLRIGQRILV